jgi:hypothetical protein
MSNVIHLAKPRNPPPPPNRVRPLKPNPDRERVIAEMLSRYHQLDTPDTGNPGDKATTASSPANTIRVAPGLNSHGTTATAGRPCTCWVAAIDELTRCLETMRKLRKQRAIAYLDRNDASAPTTSASSTSTSAGGTSTATTDPPPSSAKPGKASSSPPASSSLCPSATGTHGRRRPRRASGSSPTSSAAARAFRVTWCRCSGRPLDLRRTRLLPSAQKRPA